MAAMGRTSKVQARASIITVHILENKMLSFASPACCKSHGCYGRSKQGSRKGIHHHSAEQSVARQIELTGSESVSTQLDWFFFRNQTAEYTRTVWTEQEHITPHNSIVHGTRMCGRSKYTTPHNSRVHATQQQSTRHQNLEQELIADFTPVTAFWSPRCFHRHRNVPANDCKLKKSAHLQLDGMVRQNFA